MPGGAPRRLIRARDLSEFRHALGSLALEGEPLEAARRGLILPTRTAVAVFRETLETLSARLGRRAMVLPSLLTRDEWLVRLHESVPGAPPLLTRFDRELLLERAARAAAVRPSMSGAPFEIRPGLVSEMLTFYDELRRRQRTVRSFSRTLLADLKGERGTDRGSDSLIHQTCFLAFAFLGYERGVAASGGWDEHHLRQVLIANATVAPFDHLVIAVADHPSDPSGLWPADFYLLGRFTGVSRLDVVVTDDTHDAGFRDRIEHELPGIEEVRADALWPPVSRPAATLIRPAKDDALCFVHRDREEELREVARRVRGSARRTGFRLDERVAVVFQRPLPYLYLAGQVFADARVPFQTFDALPLASEPHAAVVDLIIDVARTGGTRESVVALLRSPLLQFDDAGEQVTREDAAALDGVLKERRPVGDAGTYPAEVDRAFSRRSTRQGVEAARALRAAHAAAAMREALQPVREAPAASAQINALRDFLRRQGRPIDETDPLRERLERSRAAVAGVLDALAAACARHDDRHRPVETLTVMIRHWIERHTFAPRHSSAGGVRLVDAVTARFGEFDHAHVVGLVEHEWPDRTHRNIFFSSGLLRTLGWPQEKDRARAQQAAFRDLLALPLRTLHLHGFQLEGDALVALSPFVELARGLPSAEASTSRAAVFADELLTADVPASSGSVIGDAWLQRRASRPPLTDRRYAGFVGPRPPMPYRVSSVDRYVDCPFKYFSERVLHLPEERDETAGLSPLERGSLVHTLFEEFYRQWQHAGRGTITAATLPDALDLFSRLTRDALASMPEADRALEETRLLGSIVARGIAERVFELEADAGGDITERLLEFVLEGPFMFPRMHGFDQRAVEIRGKADRIDVFRNGDLRVIDYKLSRLPDKDTSIQVAVYAHAVQQRLEARDGRPHAVTQAMYLAFGDENKTEGRLAAPGGNTTAEVLTRASAFSDAIDRIERGEFPPAPRKPGECQWCRYAGVCRKEYVTDAAESV